MHMTMPRLMLAMFVLLTALVLLAFRVRAQDLPPPVVVSVDNAPPTVSSDAIRNAIGAELRMPTVVASDPVVATSSPRIAVEINAAHQLVVTYRGADGRTLARTVTAPDDPMAVVATVAFLAGNLARDQAADVMATLAPPVVIVEAPTQPAPVAAPAPQPAASPEAAPSAEPPAPVAVVDPDSVDYHARQDRFAVRVSMGDGAVLDSHDGPYLELAAALRWESVAFGVSLATHWEGINDNSVDYDTSIVHQRTSLALTVAYREYVHVFGIDLFGVELGLGAGLTTYSFSGTNRGYEDMQWMVRASGSLVRPITQHVDVLASLSIETMLGDASSAGAFYTLSSVLGAGTLGLQVHF